jgi:hypothetical protein
MTVLQLSHMTTNKKTLLFILQQYTTISINVVRSKAEKSNTSAKGLLGIAKISEFISDFQ